MSSNMLIPSLLVFVMLGTSPSRTNNVKYRPARLVILSIAQPEMELIGTSPCIKASLDADPLSYTYHYPQVGQRVRVYHKIYKRWKFCFTSFALKYRRIDVRRPKDGTLQRGSVFIQSSGRSWPGNSQTFIEIYEFLGWPLLLGCKTPCIQCFRVQRRPLFKD